MTGLWSVWTCENKKDIIRIYITKGYKCISCKKPLKVRPKGSLKHNVMIEYYGKCKNPKCSIDGIYFDTCGEKKLGVQCR